MLPYSGDSFVTLVGIFLLAIPVFAFVKKNIFKTLQEQLWEETCQRKKHLALLSEADELTNRRFPSVDYRWTNAKSSLRGALRRCRSGYEADKIFFLHLSIFSTFVSCLCISLLLLAFYYSSTHSVKAADAMLISGEIVFAAFVMAEVYILFSLKEVESPTATFFYSVFASFLAIAISIAWTLWASYPKIISPEIAKTVYYIYVFLPYLPFAIYLIQTLCVYRKILGRFSQLKRAISDFKAIEHELNN